MKTLALTITILFGFLYSGTVCAQQDTLARHHSRAETPFLVIGTHLGIPLGKFGDHDPYSYHRAQSGFANIGYGLSGTCVVPLPSPYVALVAESALHVNHQDLQTAVKNSGISISSGSFTIVTLQAGPQVHIQHNGYRMFLRATGGGAYCVAPSAKAYSSRHYQIANSNAVSTFAFSYGATWGIDYTIWPTTLLEIGVGLMHTEPQYKMQQYTSVYPSTFDGYVHQPTTILSISAGLSIRLAPVPKK